MVTSNQCFEKYGDPTLERSMILMEVPGLLRLNVLPDKIYCNEDFMDPFLKALENLVDGWCWEELKTYDGVFNIRKSRGLNQMSLHSWGVAIDLNAKDNPLNMSRERCIEAGLNPFSDNFVACFKDAGFDWGGDWKRADGMHFQLSKI